MQKDSIKNIMETIKKDHITPKTIFQIRWKSYIFWFVWGCIMILGAISFSLMILNVLDVRPEFFHHLGIGRYVRVLFVTAPYLWIALALIAAITGYIAIRKTRHGYRYNILFISSISVLVIMLLGAVVHMFRFNDHIGKGMANGGVPRNMIFPAEGRLGRPEDGMIGGRVVEVMEDHLIIAHPHGDQWTIMFDDQTQIDLPYAISEGAMIEVVGELSGGNVFYAKFIRPLPERMPRAFVDEKNMKRDRYEEKNKKRDAITNEKIMPLPPQDSAIPPIE